MKKTTIVEVAVGIVLAILISNFFRLGFDDTDNKRLGEMFGKRSRLALYTDHLTGVQYVSAGLFGGITPRLDKDGKPILAK